MACASSMYRAGAIHRAWRHVGADVLPRIVFRSWRASDVVTTSEGAGAPVRTMQMSCLAPPMPFPARSASCPGPSGSGLAAAAAAALYAAAAVLSRS